jgi:hypothetical protein
VLPKRPLFPSIAARHRVFLGIGAATVVIIAVSSLRTEAGNEALDFWLQNWGGSRAQEHSEPAPSDPQLRITVTPRRRRGGESEGGDAYCVRTCDGYYFPISYSTVPGRFADDQKSCQRLCPAAEAVLYSYRNPGEDMQQAVSVNGHPYTELPNAFRYRREINAACSCRRPGQSWADALKNADDRSTIERGDIVVTQDKAKQLSLAPGQAKATKANAKAAAAAAAAAAAVAPPPALDDATETDPAKRTVRTVGPTFLPGR